MSKDNESLRRAAIRQTSVRVLWMLLVVTAAVLAYVGLGALEKAKSTYEGEQSKPLAIVDKDASTGRQQRDATELSTSEVKAKLPDDLQPFIDKIKHQSFRNENELLTRFNEEIVTDADASKKVFQDDIDNLNKNSIKESSNFLTQISAIKGASPEALKEVADPEKAQTLLIQLQTYIDSFKRSKTAREAAQESIKNAVPDLAKARALLTQAKTYIDSHTKSVALYEATKAARREDIKKVDDQTQSRLKTVYINFKPALNEMVTKVKGEAQNNSSFNPSSVFNEKNGSYVIYQTIWLTFVVILVFGVLYVILMILRPLPPFAGGTKALTEQAKSFLSRRGGGGGGGGGSPSSAPEFARTLVVTAAALGIGAAVVVASGGAGRKTTPVASADYSDEEAQVDNFRPNNKYVASNNRPGTGPSASSGSFDPSLLPAPTVNISPIVTPPSVNYYPINRVDVPRLYRTRLDQLSADVSELKDDKTGVRATLNAETYRLGKEIATVDQKFGDITLPLSEHRFSNLENKVSGLETDAGKLRSDFLAKLDTTSTTIEDIRGDSLERFRRPEGRNIFTRFKQLFAGEQYVVSNQAYMALENLMKMSRACTDSSATCPCGGDPKKACPVYKDSNAVIILETLKGLIGMKPVDESTFLGNFNRDAIKPWKTLILRYTRVPH